MTITADQLREATSAGYRTLQAIADDFDVSKQRILQLMTVHAIQRPERPPTPWDEMTAAQLYKIAPRSRWPREGIPAVKARIGLCRRQGCYAATEPNRHHCRKHLTYLVRYRTRVQKLHRETGLCTQCNAPIEPGKSMCRRHLDAMARWHRAHRSQLNVRIRARRAERRQAGECIYCRGPVEKPRGRMCFDHAEKVRVESNAKRAAARAAEGRARYERRAKA